MIARDVLTILFLFVFILSFTVALNGEEPTGNFRLVLGRIMQDDSFHIVTDYILGKEQPENELLLYFLPISNSYLYLFTISTQQEFRLIFPDRFSIFNNASYNYRPYEFYKADILPFDTVCPAEICMLVSSIRLPKFERLTDAYLSATPSGKTVLIADILMELTRLCSQRYLIDAAGIPWETTSIPCRGETVRGKQIELIAQEFNYYFMIVFRYECE